MPIIKPSSKPMYQLSSDPNVLKQGSQESQESLQRNLIICILHIIFYFSSRQRYTQTRRRGSLKIYHIGVHTLYYENCALLLSTIYKIQNKEKHEQMKAILFNLFLMELNTLLFNTINPKIGHTLCVSMCK